MSLDITKLSKQELINATAKFVRDGHYLFTEAHLTKGFAFRPGWHCCSEPIAPHLSEKGRVWKKVEIEDYTEVQRPIAQGGLWYLANKNESLEVEMVIPGPGSDLLKLLECKDIIFFIGEAPYADDIAMGELKSFDLYVKRSFGPNPNRRGM